MSFLRISTEWPGSPLREMQAVPPPTEFTAHALSPRSKAYAHAGKSRSQPIPVFDLTNSLKYAKLFALPAPYFRGGANTARRSLAREPSDALGGNAVDDGGPVRVYNVVGVDPAPAGPGLFVDEDDLAVGNFCG